MREKTYHQLEFPQKKKCVFSVHVAHSIFDNFYANASNRGFRSALNDPCLWTNGKVLCLIYIDDCLLYAKKESDIDEALELISKPTETDPDGFNLKVESDVAGFLGILFSRKSDNTIELTQTGLIERIIDACGMSEANGCKTPASTTPLHKDEEGDPCHERFSYASIVGMLMYLASSTRPDIAFSVHQCAWFTHSPKRSHEQAVKRIVRYLITTKDKGMIIRPHAELNIDLYADADFAGLWSSENKEDPISVKSRSGFLITLASVPLIWSSKLQTEIALSTIESEYNALSTAMRDFELVKNIYNEVRPILNLPDDTKNNLSRVFEDNQAALMLAASELPKMTPRSKYIGVKYHWFREKLSELNVQLVKLGLVLLI